MLLLTLCWPPLDRHSFFFLQVPPHSHVQRCLDHLWSAQACPSLVLLGLHLPQPLPHTYSRLSPTFSRLLVPFSRPWLALRRLQRILGSSTVDALLALLRLLQVLFCLQRILGSCTIALELLQHHHLLQAPPAPVAASPSPAGSPVLPSAPVASTSASPGAVPVPPMSNQHNMATRAKSGFRVPSIYHAAPLSPVPRSYRAALVDPNCCAATEFSAV